MKKRFKILRILSKYEVIINAGQREGVEEGDILKIVDTNSSKIIDLDTQEVLGELESFKNQLIAKEVHEKYSICKTRDTYNSSSTFLAMTSISKSLSGVAQEELFINEDDIENVYDEYSYAKVEIGDYVISTK
ncbi:hypothetical protein [Carnobacterium maltaromaticum]|uniref:hypothetical protein n=1 Tax=Carnobacterium maltaromaticum TaxID=2751 RepID=UPI0039B02282